MDAPDRPGFRSDVAADPPRPRASANAAEPAPIPVAAAPNSSDRRVVAPGVFARRVPLLEWRPSSSGTFHSLGAPPRAVVLVPSV